MAVGDVTVTIVSAPLTEATIDTAITAIRTSIGANGTWNMISHGTDVIISGIEEA